MSLDDALDRPMELAEHRASRFADYCSDNFERLSKETWDEMLSSEGWGEADALAERGWTLDSWRKTDVAWERVCELASNEHGDARSRKVED